MFGIVDQRTYKSFKAKSPEKKSVCPERGTVPVVSLSYMWNALLSVGDAYAEKCLLRATGVRAAWRLLMPADAVVWFEAQQWSDAELARVGK